MLSRRRFLMIAAALLCLSSQSWAADHSKLRLVIDEWPPYERADGSSAEGYAVALTETVLKQMGYPLQHPSGSIPWTRALAMIRDGQADVAVSALWSEERARIARFPQEPLFEARNAIFGLRSPRLPLQQASDLAGLRLGSVHGFLYPEDFLMALPASTQVVTSYDSPSNLRSLYLGRIDAVIEDERTAAFLIEQRHWQDRIDPTPLIYLRSFKFFAIFSTNTVPQNVVDEFSSRLADFKRSAACRKLAARYQMKP